MISPKHPVPPASTLLAASPVTLWDRRRGLRLIRSAWMGFMEHELPADVDRERLSAQLRDALSQTETAMSRMESLWVHKVMSEMLKHLPPSLLLSSRERQRLMTFIDAALDRSPNATWSELNETWSELLWRFAIDQTRPRSRGRKKKWAGAEGVLFVLEVELLMEAIGLKWNSDKGLRKAISILREREPSFAKHSEERLRRAYYEALPRYLAAYTQRGKSTE
jgi:hypothetical protein